MTRSRAGVLWLGALCLWVACGPGVSRELEPGAPDGGGPDSSAINSETSLTGVDSEWADVEAKQIRVRVRGTGFTPEKALILVDTPVPYTFVSDTELVAAIPMEGRAWSAIPFTVGNPAPGGRRAPPLYLPYPRPELFSVSPDTVVSEPDAPLRVTVTGRNFLAGGMLRFRGKQYPTTVLGTGSAEAELPTSALFAIPREEGASLSISAPGPLAIETQPLPLMSVRDPEPHIEGVWPPTLSATAAHDTADGGVYSSVPLSIRGRDLRPFTEVTWNGRPVRSAHYQAHDVIHLSLPREELSAPGVASLRLQNSQGQVSPPFLVPVLPGPALHELSPQRAQVSALSGAGALALAIYGEGFGRDSVVYWNDRALVTTHGGNTRGDSLQATVPPEELALPGTQLVTVRRGSDGTVSEALPFQVVTETTAPVALSLQPAVVTTGVEERLVVSGRDFTKRSVVRLDGQDRSTSFGSEELLTITLTGADLAQAGVRTVTVHTPGPGGGTSLPLLLRVDARRPVPSLKGMSELSVTAGGGARSFDLWGHGMGPYSEVRWNGEVIPSSWSCCDSGGLDISVPARLLETPGVARVKVTNPAPGGGTSEELLFVIREPGASSLRLSTLVLERPDKDLFLEVRGSSGFTEETQFLMNGRMLASTHTGSIFRALRLSPEDLSAPGPVEFQAVTPGQPPSAPAYLHVVGPRPPQLRALNPAVVSVGSWDAGQQYPLFVEGLGFASFDYSWEAHALVTTVDWGGASHPLAYHWDWNIGFHAQLDGADLARPGTLLVSVSRAAEGGTSSLPAILNVVTERPVPLITGVQPATVRAGAPALWLRVSGASFHTASKVYWNDEPLPTRQWQSYSERGLEARVPGTSLTARGTASVTVVTPGPGGGTSLPLAVRVE
ncbi:hypothetical protein [Pyxidicoccus xibeiensis]|uniref:hypothetical protein n=1 Tax=Pyxidicoccus xibeiensis TaxID=2906759 RepID=UPI0020A81BF3|nr:hypothetical protein [Pyxidicoccus xibeiensis]MCP3143516.1 hypothetical protein [Pyxidicoccus xibeiensis]